MSPDPFDDLLPALLDLGLHPPSVRLDEPGRRRIAAEFGDFRGHVPYSAGEDLRFLDWNVYARSGHKMLRRFDGLEHHRLVLVLDLSASVAERWPGMQRLARLYGFLGAHHFDSVELILLEEAGARDLVFAGPESWPRMRECLQELKPGGRRGLADLGPVLERGGRVRGRVLVSDFQPEHDCAEALGSLADRGHSMICVFPRLQWEAGEAEVALGPADLVDPESGGRLDLVVTRELVTLFREEQARWERRMDLLCRELGHELRVATLPGDDRVGDVDAWLPFLSSEVGTRT